MPPSFTRIYDSLILSKDLSPNEKVVLFVLLSYNKDVLWGKKTSIYPNQNTLSEQCGISRTTINRVINSLREKKLIRTHLQVDRASLIYELVTKTVVSDINKVVAETDRVVSDIHNGCIKSEQGVVSDMHTIKNYNKDYKELYKEVVDYLNKKCKANYKYATASTKKHLSARINEGYIFDNFKTVIDRKYSEWSTDPNMMQYLRPETLFGNKFEGYLNQIGIKQEVERPRGREIR